MSEEKNKDLPSTEFGVLVGAFWLGVLVGAAVLGGSPRRRKMAGQALRRRWPKRPPKGTGGHQ